MQVSGPGGSTGGSKRRRKADREKLIGSAEGVCKDYNAVTTGV
jgi:hypothetical protein